MPLLLVPAPGLVGGGAPVLVGLTGCVVFAGGAGGGGGGLTRVVVTTMGGGSNVPGPG